MRKKAGGSNFVGRFREIVSDPLNLVIRRDPRAGFVSGKYVILHNGLKVPIAGPHAYYGQFSSILRINRGVHEPLEEFVFQEVLNRLPSSPVMLELGAYWGHYSMWLKKSRPDAVVHLVEPELKNLKSGEHNFQINGFDGTFVQAFVGKDQFMVDEYLHKNDIKKLDVLHSDVQGYEVEMLADCKKSLETKLIDFVFVSTHSQQLHLDVERMLGGYDYRVEISSDFDTGTTSFDGFIFASNNSVEPVFNDFTPLSRVQIEEAQPADLLSYLSSINLVAGESSDD